MKLAHKALLLLAIPLALVLTFLALLMHGVEEAQLDTVKEARQGRALVYVNLVVYDAMDAAMQFFMLHTMKQPRFAIEFNETLSKLEEHRVALRDIQRQDSNQNEEFAAFVKLVDDFDDLFTQAKEIMSSGNTWGQTRIVANVRNYLKRVTIAGNTIIESQMKHREQLLEQHNDDARKIRDAIVVFAAIIVFVAIALALALNLIFQRNLDVLSKNAQFIAVGKPLLPPLRGAGELVQLDQTIHYLSEALAKARSDERALIDYAAEIICSIDEHMRVTQVNPAVHKLLGVSDRDFLGTSIQSWVTEEDRQSTFAQLESCKSAADGAIFEARMRHSDGTTVYTSWNARWSGERNSFFCVMHDITERKEVEQLKQQVLAMVSHDLRSPLASIGITMELLKEGVFGTLNEKGTSVLDKAQGSITSLVTMVNELLEIERFEYGGGALNMVRAPILQSALNAIDLVGAQADKKGIEIETKCGKIESTFDPERITRVFANLLGNAIKFAPEHSEIMITATAIEDGTPAKNRWIEVRVSDQGSGIPPEKQSVIFEKFKQSGRNDAGEKAGTGLGLAICKAIVEAHGGTIGVESTIGEGSTFWFRLKQD